MKKVLISGFEPFGSRADNPSADAVAAIPGILDDITENIEVHKIILPVVFGRAAELLLAEAERLSPDAVICFGLAAGRAFVTPEVTARNICGITADNSGAVRSGKISDTGMDEYVSTLPTGIIIDALRLAGIPAQLSDDAGKYVCNDTFYRLMNSALTCPRGFVHLPDLAVEINGKAVEICVKNCLL